MWGAARANKCCCCVSSRDIFQVNNQAESSYMFSPALATCNKVHILSCIKYLPFCVCHLGICEIWLSSLVCGAREPELTYTLVQSFVCSALLRREWVCMPKRSRGLIRGACSFRYCVHRHIMLVWVRPATHPPDCSNWWAPPFNGPA